MPDSLKRKALAFILLAAILTALIAMALPQLDLQPGIPLPRAERYSSGSTPADSLPTGRLSMDTWIKAFVVISGLLLLAYCGYLFIKETPRQVFLHDLRLMLGLTLLALIGLYIFFALFSFRSEAAPAPPDEPPPPAAVSGPPLGPLPPALIWLVWIGLAAGLIFLGLWFIRWQTQRRRPASPLVQEAEIALQSLITGSDFTDVILRCYAQMSRVLKQEQEIEPTRDMTAREFEQLLEAKGFPGVAVHQLTRLFEAARYSRRPPLPGDEQKAIDSLNAIVQYGRTQKLTAGGKHNV